MQIRYMYTRQWNRCKTWPTFDRRNNDYMYLTEFWQLSNVLIGSACDVFTDERMESPHADIIQRSDSLYQDMSYLITSDKCMYHTQTSDRLLYNGDL